MKELTDKQQKFLEVLFEEAEGDPAKAKKLAGYSSSYSIKDITSSLSEEIEELTRNYLALNAPRAAVFMVRSINPDPTNLISREKLAAAKDILDRAGLKTVDRMEVETNNPMFILPAKEHVDSDSEN